MVKLLKERLKLLVRDSGKSPRAISIEATGKPDAIRDILRNKVVNARSDTIRMLAKTLKTTVAYLTGEGDEPYPSKALDNNGLIAARVVSSVQAGAFMEIESSSPYEDDPKWMPAIRDPRFPNLDPIAFEVLGDSIDLKCPPGGYAICLPFDETGLQVKDGLWVVAERQRGNMIERTIKQVRKVADRFELHPASTNKKWKPIRFPSAEPHEEVRIIALVLRFLGPSLPV